MARHPRPKIPPTATPDERVAALEAELAELPMLEAQALDDGDEDALVRIAARSRIISRELASARVEAIIAPRQRLSDELTALNTELLEHNRAIEELEFAVVVYSREVEQSRALAAQQRQRGVSLMSRITAIDEAESAALAALDRSGMEVRNGRP